MKLSIIMPVHSERDSISEIINELKRIIPRETLLEVILIIAKSSPEETMEICRRMERENDFVKMRVQKDIGFGMAYREAFGYASGDYVLMLDSDGEFELSTIPKMIILAEKGEVDLIQACRWIPGGGAEGYEPLTYIMNRLFQYIFRFLLWTKIHDLTFGYKMLKKKVINSIEWEGKKHELAMETTIKPIKYGFKVAEVPSFWRKRRDGQSKNPGWMRIKLYTPLALRVAFGSKKIIN
ncbi:MAG: glycosyltransferase [Patescibacteria group bacterium]